MRAAETPRFGSERDERAWHFFIFRKARETLSSPPLKRNLLDSLRTALAQNSQHCLLNALVRAGELECALADVGSPELLRAMQAVDTLASATLNSPSAAPAWQSDLVATFDSLQLPASVSLSHAEGFSYYGLHPLDFWDLADRIALPASAAIVGIRSIGTTLSSIVAEALRRRGIPAERITVRPSGSPYQRRLIFTSQQLAWVHEHLERGSDFLVVDEGPGFSGSSFTAVGRALRQAGVPNLRILFMGSRAPGLNELESNFDSEWNSFRFCSVVQGTRVPAAAKIYCGGGVWRQYRFPHLASWPACWTQLERNKYFSADRASLFKFEGFGRYGEAVYERSQRLAEAGYAPRPLGYDNGFVEYATAMGEPVQSHARPEWLLKRMARYCAYRATAEPAAAPGAVSLDSMVTHNLQVEFGLEELRFELPLEKLVMADSRMMPHEWIGCGEELVKSDGASHGDDHLFPGPTDVAWDLAGVITEWGLTRGEQEFFLREYQRCSGDDPSARIPAYLLAYSVFRMACCRMGAAAMAAWEEAHRLEREYRRHRRRVTELLGLSNRSDRSHALPSQLPAGLTGKQAA